MLYEAYLINKLYIFYDAFQNKKSLHIYQNLNYKYVKFKMKSFAGIVQIVCSQLKLLSFKSKIRKNIKYKDHWEELRSENHEKHANVYLNCSPKLLIF